MEITTEFREAVKAARIPKHLDIQGKRHLFYDVSHIAGVEHLPRALVILLENCIRRAQDDQTATTMAARIMEAGLQAQQGAEIEYMPSRVLFQDFTGVPVFVDFAAMRDAMAERGGDPTKVSPRIPCTLVVDHSVIADCSGCKDAAQKNEHIEALRNHERFAFLKWAAKSFDNVRIVPPGSGICHQLNIERFCEVVSHDALSDKEEPLACFDTLVGTDSHTTTANGLGVLAWGVGGIEAEAAALGQAITMLVPPVVELKLSGALGEYISGMDLALSVAELLRREGVVGSLVEVTGEGVASLSATQRACVANMTPEYGATTTLFPVDTTSLEYLRLTGRSEEQIELVDRYLRAQGVFGSTSERRYARTITLDLSTIEPSLAGPSRPHERVSLAGLGKRFHEGLAAHGRANDYETMDYCTNQTKYQLTHGAIAIAAITSCTTATDPAMMLAAGLLAHKAVERGLKPLPWVKKILAPGSHATALMLSRAGYLEDLRALGFDICGFGCMSCIGNSGDIDPQLHEHASTLELTSVLSGNRNFEGRISPDVSQNYLCQPALVVAYSLVGTVDIDLTQEALGTDASGNPVMLSDVLPTKEDIEQALVSSVDTALFSQGGEKLFEGSRDWQAIEVEASNLFAWDEASTYVRRAPYFERAQRHDHIHISDARALALLGDFVTTDHISPAGSIAQDSAAACYLIEHGVKPQDFNTYGSRRGNHEVMARGTFANIRLKNTLVAPLSGGLTKDFLDGECKSIFDAAMDYQDNKVDLVVLAGKMYGSGSSRDWAGKGPALLGVRAVIAESFERIHRSNLVQMGIVPLQLAEGQSAQSLGLDGSERFDIEDIDLLDTQQTHKICTVRAQKSDGTAVSFDCVVRVDTPREAEYLSAGGILPYVLDQLCS